MLIRLLPEQVSAAWDAIAPVIAEGLPPMQQASHRTMVRILEAILADRLIVWSYLDEKCGSTKAIVSTAIYRDPVIESSYLLIYSFTSLQDMSVEDWKDGIETLRKYAYGLEVEGMIAYTANKGIIKMATSRLQASAEFTVLEF